jgi:DNA-binding CsgD family transcriptional regulator
VGALNSFSPFEALTDFRTGPPFNVQGLTLREVEVLKWVVSGKTNPEIGLILNISGHTVSKHLQNVFTKLGVGSRTAAVVSFLEITSGV